MNQFRLVSVGLFLAFAIILTSCIGNDVTQDGDDKDLSMKDNITFTSKDTKNKLDGQMKLELEITANANSTKDSDVMHKRQNTPPNKEWIDNILDQHNIYRKDHKVPLLVISTEISVISQQWADELATKNIFEHSSTEDYGENIYKALGKKFDARDPVRLWYSELDKYVYGAENDYLVSGHFTQVVWKGSKELGIGVSKNKDSWFVVCNYFPPGNVQGEYEENVLKPNSKKYSSATGTYMTPDRKAHCVAFISLLSLYYILQAEQ